MKQDRGGPSAGALLASLLILLLSGHVASLPSTWSSANAPGRRAIETGPAGFGSNLISSREIDSSAVPSLHPSAFPYITLKPFLPINPAANPFAPSLGPASPQSLIDKKAELLNNLFTGLLIKPGVASGSNIAEANSKQALITPARRSVVPWMSTEPTTSGSLSSASAISLDPSAFLDKKADFLSKLFSSVGGSKPAGAGTTTGIVPPGFWMPPFLTSYETSLNAGAGTSVTAPPASGSVLLSQLLNMMGPDGAQSASPPILLAPTPTPKSMIVPPSYWIPVDPLAGPDVYTKKVSDFLDKLFKSLESTASVGTMGTRATATRATSARTARHHNEWRPQDLERAVAAFPNINAPNAALTPNFATKDTIVNEILTEVGALKADMLDTLNDLITQEKAAVAAATPTKRPKLGPFLWGPPTPKPTLDPTAPYQKRLDTLAHVFDMLTTLGQQLAAGGGNSVGSPTIPAGTTAISSRTARSARNARGAVPERSVQMAVHQGYQSLPAGAQELISAGAGRDPDSAHEGGGLNLKILMPQR